MKGKNNVWKNIKTIIKEKEFKPLRIAILSQFVFTLILTQLGILVYQYYTNPSRTATMFLTQTNWGWGASTTLSAIHPTDLTSWNYFYSTSTPLVNTSVAGQVSLTLNEGTATQTSDTDFNTWTKDSSLVTSSTGSSGRIVLLKPNGATCTQASECSGGGCNGSNQCYTPPCGSLTTVDYSGITYPLVNIGTQCWFAKNLNVGTKLASVSTMPSNNSLIEKWCYDNSDAFCTSYGGLYTWAEANQMSTGCNSSNTGACVNVVNQQGICPSGWHIPTNSEFYTLELYLGMCAGSGSGCVYSANQWRGTTPGVGTKLKSGGSSGFNALLTGAKLYSSFAWINGGDTYLWFADTGGATDTWDRQINAGQTGTYSAWVPKTNGLLVRCLKN
ncbi:MAG: fibrobacter succinogenes major paralogous domain-containing protein [Candidatus Magasanikbacteria bacterium]